MDVIGTMQEIRQEENEIWRRAIANGDMYPGENEISLNDVQRRKIRAFAEINNDSCWIGNINLYKDNQTILEEYHLGNMVYNFGGAFIIADYDIHLEWMILERSRTPYTGTTADYLLVNAIVDKIEELGGMNLHWV